MKKLLLLACLLAPMAFSQAPTVSNISASEISHSSLLLHFDVSAPWQNVRIRFIKQASGSCSAGTGGSIQGSAYPGNNTFRPQIAFRIILSGLDANTPYYVCPEVSANGDNAGGGTWSTGAQFGVTTLPFPSVHPALPIDPTDYNPVYPDTTNYRKVTMTTGCVSGSDAASTAVIGAGSSFQAVMDNSIGNQLNAGTLILFPDGTVCDRLYQPSSDSPGLTTFPVSNIASDSSITITGSGYAEGQGLIFTHGYNAGLPGAGNPDPTAQDPKLCTGIIAGYVYYAHRPDPANTNKFTLTCNAPFGQPGALAMTFQNFGFGSIKVETYPTNRNWVIVRTVNTGAAWLPDGVRVGPAWSAHMPKFSMRLNQHDIGPGYEIPQCNGVTMVRLTACDGGEGRMVSNIWFKGVEFTHVKSVDGATSTDPNPFESIIDISRMNQDIVFDQIYFHGQGAPDRLHRPISSWDGHNVAFLNSYFSDMDIYQSDYNGLTVAGSTNTVTVSSGVHGLNGAAKYTQAGTVTFTTSGTGAGTGMIYASLDGSKLNMQLPPGRTGTCSGGPCQVFTADNAPGNGVYISSASVTYPTITNGISYAVDPIFSTSSSCTSTQTIFDDASLFNVLGGPNTPGFELGTRFQATANGFICGVRFNKPAGDTGTSHSVALWNGSGTQVGSATSSNEAASGWISVNFTSPIAYTANTTMTASYHTAGSLWLNTNLLQNRTYSTGNNTVFALATYTPSNGNCSVDDTFPLNAFGNTAVGIVGCVTFNSSGVTSVIQGNARHSHYVDDLNGCNCFIGGHGPGPWAFKNNFVSATGNVMHHDEGGYDGADYTRSNHWMRGDYNYYRDTFDVPILHMKAQQTNSGDYAIAYDPALLAVSSSSAQGNNLYYQHRQSLEFKAGQRVKANGLIFQGGFANTASSIAAAFTSVEGNGITDVQITNTTFKHVPGGLVFSSTEGGNLQTPPISRILIKNNLFWDLRPGYFAPGGPINPGNGWVMENVGHEDFVMDHNTVWNNTGRANATFWLFDQRAEGVKITNNILFMGGGPSNGGIFQEYDGNYSGPNQCTGSPAGPLGIAGCLWPNYTFTGNLLTSDQNVTQMNTWYGAATGNYIPGVNSVPGTPSDFTGVKWQDTASLSTSLANPLARPQFSLRNDSPYISGGTYKGTDGKDVGVDMIALEQAQGKVFLTGASSVTANGATITFVAPDAAACPVDYSSSDPTLISNLTRVTPAGALGPNSVALTGLSASTVYYYRVDCAVEQPTGSFRTAAPGVVLPTVTMTAPTSGATVSGTAVTVSATATAGAGVVSNVQFRMDGTNLGAADTAAPYSTTVNSVNLTNGSHTFSAVVTDSLNQQASSSTVSVTVSNFPSISITAPAAGTVLTGTAATLTASATAPTGRTVASVQFKVDGVNVGALDTTSPYTQTFDTTVWTNATHSVTAVVIDSANVTTTSAAVSFTISNNVTIASAPTVSPAAGTYTETQTVSLTLPAGATSMYYTVDGSTPTTSSLLYTAPFAISGTKTVKAIAVASGAASAVTSATYTIPDQIAQIAADMFATTDVASQGVTYQGFYPAKNEADPHGVPAGWGFDKAAVFGDMNNTGKQGVTMNAMEPWGTLYIQKTVTSGVSPAPNTKVEIKGCQVAWLQASQATNTTTHGWTTRTLLTSEYDKAYYHEDFSPPDGGNAPFRVESDGGFSIVAGVAIAGDPTSYVNHFNAPFPRIAITAGDVGGVVMSCQMRLVLNNAAGTDDRSLAKYVVNIGADYYQATGGGGGSNIPSIFGSRYKIVTPEWRTISASTLTDAQLRTNPPPIVTDLTSTVPAVAAAAGFNTLTFDEEFNSLSLGSKTGTGATWYPGLWYENPPTSNITVTSGILDLAWTQGQTSPTDTSIQTVNSQTVYPNTSGKTFRYGYYEARMKWNPVTGSWPAFWLNGDYGLNTQEFLELDIFEGQATTKTFYATLHDWKKTNGGSTVDQMSDSGNEVALSSSTDFSQWHTYGCLWTSTTIKWYLDGTLIRTAAAPAIGNTGPEVFLILSQQTGPGWNTGGAPLVNNLHNQVDYVRVWQQ